MLITKAIALQRPSIIALLVSLSLALLGAVVLVNQANGLLTRQVAHKAAAEGTKALQELKDSLLDMETGQRGFLLTGNERYLVPFEDGSSNLERLRFIVERQLKDFPAELGASVRRLLQLTVDKEQELRFTIELRRTGRREEALAIVAANFGQATMEEIRSMIDALTTEHRMQQSKLEEENAILIARAKNAIALWIMAVISLAFASFWLVLQGQRALHAAAQLLKDQASHDPLTGLPNRRYLLDWLGNASARAARSGEPLAVLFLDLDGFSEVNDKLGHDAGDVALVWAADTLKQSVRKADFVARLGGDEFVVVTSGQTVAQAEILAQCLIDAMVKGKPDLPVEPGVIGASIGIAVQPVHAGTSTALLKEADTAMYLAKQAGKRRYCLSAATEE